MRKCVQNLPSGKEIKTDATIKSKTTRDDKKMNRHRKNKTTKAENTNPLLIPLILAGPRQPHQRLRKKQAIGVSDDPRKMRSEISL
jgi:hypothetical protein